MNFDEILSRTQFSTKEAFEKYAANMPQSKVNGIRQSFNEEMARVKDKYDGSDIPEEEIMRNELQAYISQLVPLIQREYGEYIPADRIEKLYRLMNDPGRVVVINNDKINHDFSANSTEGIIIVNLAKIGVSNESPNPSIYRKVANAESVLPHELFHFVIKMLKPEYMENARIRIQLSNGEKISSKGMSGFMLNEGFVEKMANKFCNEYGLFYTPAIQYYPYIDTCKYIMENNPQVNEQTVFCLDAEDCLNGLSEQDREKYHKAEAIAYAIRHKGKQASDVVSSELEPIEVDLSNIPEKDKIRLEREEFYKNQKKEELLPSDNKEKGVTL